MACGILVPQPGTEPGSPALGTWSLHNKASREFFDFLVHNRLHYTVVSLFFFELYSSGCAGSSLLCGLISSFGEWALVSSCGVWASRCGGFSCGGAQTLGT